LKVAIVFTSTERVKGQNGLGSMFITCDRVMTYNSFSIVENEPYMEVVVENPKITYTHMEDLL
jgi:hypothetical protein